MTITANIVADSIGPKSKRILTMQLRYPRFIHSEVMTHRLFSRNASSSRAIPVERVIEDIIRDTAMPIHWGKNQPGMQAREENDELIYHEAVSPFDMLDNEFDGVTPEAAWLKARDRAIEVAEAFHSAGYHKQIVNRILEPYTHINVLVTATNFDNFYWLRRHPDAQPEIKALADAMYEAQESSTPRFLDYGEWHLPYVLAEERDYVRSQENIKYSSVPVTEEDLLKVSVARCARVSYLTHDGKSPDFEKDLGLYERLVGGKPLHASPAEHQAYPDEPAWGGWENSHLSGNLDAGWVQYRKTLPGESCETYEAV